MKNICSPLLYFLQDSKRLLNLVVLLICLFISTYQLLGCIRNLRHPPVSTHYRFVINETLNYPAVTICRNPPYKADILEQFQLGAGVIHTSEWMNFPFKNVTLQKVWDEATYPQSEVLHLYGLHELPENAEVRKAYYFFHGHCFTLVPRVGSKKLWPEAGWSVLLKHDDANTKQTDITKFDEYISPSYENYPPGFHIFIHEVKDPWSENYVHTNLITQYIYAEVGEQLEIKISPEEFKSISTTKFPCSSDINYSHSRCIETNRWLNISKQVKCTVPWMPAVKHLPHCNNYESFKLLYNLYKDFEHKHDYGCVRACNVTTYKLFVVKRAPIYKLFSHLFIYYSSKMVTVLEEHPGYDMNAFLSDLGGSLGFFLGLSVIGMIGIIERFLQVIFCYAKPVPREDKQPLDNTVKNEKI